MLVFVERRRAHAQTQLLSMVQPVLAHRSVCATNPLLVRVRVRALCVFVLDWLFVDCSCFVAQCTNGHKDPSESDVGTCGVARCCFYSCCICGHRHTYSQHARTQTVAERLRARGAHWERTALSVRVCCVLCLMWTCQILIARTTPVTATSAAVRAYTYTHAQRHIHTHPHAVNGGYSSWSACSVTCNNGCVLVCACV